MRCPSASQNVLKAATSNFVAWSRLLAIICSISMPHTSNQNYASLQNWRKFEKLFHYSIYRWLTPASTCHPNAISHFDIVIIWFCSQVMRRLLKNLTRGVHHANPAKPVSTWYTTGLFWDHTCCLVTSQSLPYDIRIITLPCSVHHTQCIVTSHSLCCDITLIGLWHQWYHSDIIGLHSDRCSFSFCRWHW